jgi:hypothetical protein
MKQIVLIYIFSTLIDGRYKTTQNKYIYKSYYYFLLFFYFKREERRRRRRRGEKREEERESERVFLFVVGHWSS